MPAGTVHAVGGGVLFAEIQQTSDATFRLFDWNRRDAQGRSRPLHLEEGLAAIHWHENPPSRTQIANFALGVVPSESQRQPLVQAPYFDLTFGDIDCVEPSAARNALLTSRTCSDEPSAAGGVRALTT